MQQEPGLVKRDTTRMEIHGWFGSCGKLVNE
jgi:hypothetical protein